MTANFRNGIYAGLIAAAIGAIYLFQLWQPDRQVELHADHMLRAIEANNWTRVGSFIAPSYHDQWNQDRERVLVLLQQVTVYTPQLKLDAHEPLVFASGTTGEWRAQVTAHTSEGEVMPMLDARINHLAEPFELHWARRSWKPWDWKLVSVGNPSLELPSTIDLM